MVFKRTIQAEETTFPSWKLSTKVVTVPGPTPKSPWRLDRATLQNGFKIYCQTVNTGPVVFVITYDPSMDGQSQKTFETCHNYYEGTVLDGSEEYMFKIDFPVKVEADNRPLSDTMKCTVCYRLFSDVENSQKPKSLPGCGHTFCSFCVERLHRKLCPTCRNVNDVAAEKIPINYTLMNLIGEIRTERNNPSRQERVDDPFVPCFEDPKHESKVYCNDCHQAYCQRCFADAHIAKFMKHHKTIPVIEMPVIIPKCPNCPNEKLSDEDIYYCSLPGCAGNKITCIRCSHTHHKNHNVTSIVPLLEKNHSVAEKLFKEAQEVVSQYENMRENLYEVMEDPYKQRADHITQIQNHFDNLKRIALSQYNEFMDKELKKIDDALDHNVRNSVRMESMKNRIEGCLKRKSNLHDADNLLEWAKRLLLENRKKEVEGEFFPPKEYVITPDMSVDPKPPSKRPRLEIEDPVEDPPAEDPEVAPPVIPVNPLAMNDHAHDWQLDPMVEGDPVMTDDSDSEVDSDEADDIIIEDHYRNHYRGPL